VRYQDLRREVLTVADELKLAQTTRDTKRLSEIRSSGSPELKMVEQIKHTEQALKELRAERSRLKAVLEKGDNPAIQKRIDKNNETQKAMMMRVLKRYNGLLDEKV
jgi:galactokinase/mevalonate kinase-like predicted kinase